MSAALTEDAEARIRAAAILETLDAVVSTGKLALAADEAGELAMTLNVPVGLVWCGLSQMAVEDVDALAAWWVRREA